MDHELCPVCGASWACEHREPIEREPEPHIRTAYVLHRIADRIEQGLNPGRVGDEHTKPDALILVLSEGDIHRVLTFGYGNDDPRYRQAQWAVMDSTSLSPEQRAENRAKEAAQREAERLIYEVAHPWICEADGLRFKTERGLIQHHRRNWRHKV